MITLRSLRGFGYAKAHELIEISVDEQCRQPVHQRPRSNARRRTVDSHHLTGRAIEKAPGTPNPTLDLGIVSVIQLRPKHHLEMRPMVNGESDVGRTNLDEVGTAIGHSLEAGREHLEPLGGERRQQACLVAKMMHRRRVGDITPTSDLAQTHPSRTVLGNDLGRRIEQGPPQVSVVVCRFAGGHLGEDTAVAPQLNVDKMRTDAYGRSHIFPMQRYVRSPFDKSAVADRPTRFQERP